MRRIVLLAVVLLCGIGQAEGSIHIRDWQNPGDGMLTFDTESGLEWLDWTATTNLSYEEVSPQLDLGGDYYGFRYATLDEVGVLYDNAGLGPQVAIHNWSESPRTGIFGQLIDMLGVTSSTGPDHKYSKRKLPTWKNRCNTWGT
jgi:hypothetical protein